MPSPTGKYFPFFIGKEYIFIANIHTINDFFVYTSSSSDPATTTAISSTTASKAPSATSVSVSSYSIHQIDAAPEAATAHLGEIMHASVAN